VLWQKAYSLAEYLRYRSSRAALSPYCRRSINSSSVRSITRSPASIAAMICTSAGRQASQTRLWSARSACAPDRSTSVGRHRDYSPGGSGMEEADYASLQTALPRACQWPSWRPTAQRQRRSGHDQVPRTDRTNGTDQRKGPTRSRLVASSMPTPAGSGPHLGTEPLPRTRKQHSMPSAPNRSSRARPV
jgi:hypothetical protein